MNPTGPPQLSKQPGDQNNKEKQDKIEKNDQLKIQKTDLFSIFGPKSMFPDIWRCAIGRVRPVESESEVKNAKFRQLELKK